MVRTGNPAEPRACARFSSRENSLVRRQPAAGQPTFERHLGMEWNRLGSDDFCLRTCRTGQPQHGLPCRDRQNHHVWGLRFQHHYFLRPVRHLGMEWHPMATEHWLKWTSRSRQRGHGVCSDARRHPALRRRRREWSVAWRPLAIQWDELERSAWRPTSSTSHLALHDLRHCKILSGHVRRRHPRWPCQRALGIRRIVMDPTKPGIRSSTTTRAQHSL